jgi:uncharacterized DUF497 family protein
MDVIFAWSEAKRESNRVKHRLDFADAVAVFTGVTFTVEDTRYCYSERRYITLGLLHEIPVCIIHTDHAHEIRILSFRKATRREAEIYFDEVRY